MPANAVRGGDSHGSLGQVGSHPWLLAANRLRTLRIRLIASAWVETLDPYLLLEVPEEELLRWVPGFEVALDGIVDVVPNPYASVERYDEMIVLLLHGYGFWTPAPFADWPHDGDCDVIVVARGRLPPEEGADRELALADLVNRGQAYFSMVPIEAPDSGDMVRPGS